MRRDAGGVVADGVDGADGVADDSACSDADAANDAVADRRERAAYATAADGNAFRCLERFRELTTRLVGEIVFRTNFHNSSIIRSLDRTNTHTAIFTFCSLERLKSNDPTDSVPLCVNRIIIISH